MRKEILLVLKSVDSQKIKPEEALENIMSIIERRDNFIVQELKELQKMINKVVR